MAEYAAELALEVFQSDFVDDAIFLDELGGSKHDIDAVGRYLSLPIPARPNLSWFFDRQFYLESYHDIARAEVDPLVHFMKWGVMEGRNPHPFIDLSYLKSNHPELLAKPVSISGLVKILAGDLADPSPYFSIDFYKSQLQGRLPKGGLLRHYLQRGWREGLKPTFGFDPNAYYRKMDVRDFAVRSSLREFVPRATRVDMNEDLIGKKLDLESAMHHDPDNIQVREQYFEYLSNLSNNLLGSIFASLPEISAPIMFRAGSSDIENFTNIFSYVSGKTSEYRYGVYGFEMPKPRRILDIGAYCGYSATYFANRFPDAEIVCVEPPGANFDVLAVNIAAYPNIRSLPAAIWPHRTQVRAAGHISGDWGNVYTDETETVSKNAIPAYTIDEVLELVGWNNVDFVKCQPENVVIDVLCRGEGRWLNGVSCFCAIKPAGKWPRPGDEALLQTTFPDRLYVKISEENGLRLFTRRNAESLTAPRQCEPISLIPPPPRHRHFVLENVPADSPNFYTFNYFSLTLSPNPPGEALATLKVHLSLSGHKRFHTTIVTGSPKSGSINFHIKMRNVVSGAPVFEANHELPGESTFGWELEFETASGVHEVAISTETVRTGDGTLWARFIDPRLE